ncbi:MAG: tetratricopeptide repeat protein, partial [Candidatus Binatia bacterium]
MRRLVLLFSLLFAACNTTTSPTASIESLAATTADAAAIPEGKTPEERREIFQAAVLLFERGDLAAARPFFESSARNHPLLADHALRHLARIHARQGDRTGELAAWSALAERHPGSVWHGEAAVALAAARHEEGDSAGATRWLAEAKGQRLTPRDEARALWLESGIARAAGDLTRARRLGAEVRSRFSGSKEAIEAREQAWRERET